MPRHFTRPLCLFFCLTTLLAATQFAARADAPAVTLESLLGEMIDRDAVAQWPAPAYSCKQASSYDRTRTGPDNPQTWFNNRDYDYYIRIEEKAGRKEYVIMDETGPGCITRWWIPLEQYESINHKVRIYLDGSKTPAIDVKYYPLISGLDFVKAPFAFISSDEKDAPSQIGLPPGQKQMGADLYLPIPFARSCKITLDRFPFYYAINYRKYETGTNIKSFKMADYEAAGVTLKHAAQVLNDPKNATDGSGQSKGGTVEPGAELAIDLPAGPNAVRTLQVRIDPRDAPQVLRSTVVEAAFDGEAAVWCPLGEFFGCGARHNPVEDWCRSVDKGGKLTSRWVMPYGKSGRVAIKNHGKKSVQLKLDVGTSPWRWDDRSMHFHANWHCQYPLNTRPMSDWNYIQIQGRGVYVGDTLTVFNPVTEWYGEGDEKIYVDGEKFPSHIGTGTEDYYGYAWGMSHHFNSPFISMPLRDSKGKTDWRGYTTTSRLRLLDGIPLRSSLKMDMEVWHWADTKVGYAAGTFWYARPGATSNRGPAKESLQSLPP
ncbi:MAG: glycoside hydrolase family 172 protein [Planctomycetota bacterium]